MKKRKDILAKLGIEQLNDMQEDATLAIANTDEVILLSPTGTGKTVAFLLPILEALDPNLEEVQALILVPSRELAMQIEQVVRDMGAGFKCNAVYGGRTASKDKMELQHLPAILIGTPGRITHHIRKKTFDTKTVSHLILDEFDKSLEVGFEEEMEMIISALPNIDKKILTSATHGVEIPKFVNITSPTTIDHLGDGVSKLEVKFIISPEKDKLETLFKAVCQFGNDPGIIFCNYKDSIQRVSDFLREKGIAHASFHGGLEQIDRERALIKFRNGTHQLLLATDLAARGIDVPEIKYIIHYHLPPRLEEFTHRNGRTARMNAKGTAYVLKWAEEEAPDFIGDLLVEKMVESPIPNKANWATIFVSGGRKDKISKGDIAGHFFKQGELKKEELGIIELKNDCAFVAVKESRVVQVIRFLDNTRIKKRKVRIYEV